MFDNLQDLFFGYTKGMACAAPLRQTGNYYNAFFRKSKGIREKSSRVYRKCSVI